MWLDQTEEICPQHKKGARLSYKRGLHLTRRIIWGKFAGPSGICEAVLYTDFCFGWGCEGVFVLAVVAGVKMVFLFWLWLWGLRWCFCYGCGCGGLNGVFVLAEVVGVKMMFLFWLGLWGLHVVIC